MSTLPFLKHRRFDPEVVDSMAAAYASVCHALGLSAASDRAVGTIAPKIIEIATRGARSSSAIHLIAIQELENNKQSQQSKLPRKPRFGTERALTLRAK